jgi:hypothetical protein
LVAIMTDRFTDTFLDEVRASISITGVVGQHVQWDEKKSNPGRRDMWANCPFHGESTPSFHAQDEEGVYHCFGCGRSGDHFRFLMELQGLEFPDAVRAVAEMGGMAMPDGPQGERKPPRAPEQPRQDQGRPQPSAGEIRPEIVKIYDYTDRDGALLYQVVRMQRKLPDGTWAKNKDGKGTWKTFLQRRPDGAGKWIWSLSLGEFMRRPGGDWRVFDRDKFVEGMETRFFDAGAEHTIYRHPAVEIAIAEGQRVILTEGEKDAETAVALGFCGTTNSSGSKHWTAVHASCFQGADVIISLDNDAAGDRADKLAKSLKGIARRIRVLDFAQHVEGFDHKGDLTDWVEKFGGGAAQLQDIIARLPDYRPRPPASKFNAMAVKDAGKASQLHEWLVQDLIELHGTAAFSGYSQSGKSFQMIELAFAVALGRKFWGRPVKQGLVVYQLGEGEEGFMKRLEGYLKDRGIEDPASVPIVILPKKINLFQSDDDTTALIAEAKAWEAYWDMPLRMIVIDTYNKATRGANEISGQDIGKINDRIERIATDCNCNVTVVDHLSKGGTVRGHGSKTDDVTNMIRVEKDEKKVDRNGRPIRRMRLDKNKDGENGGVIEFVLRQVVVGFKDDGTAITTCVVEAPHGSEEELEKSGRLPLNQSLILQTIRDVIAREGSEAPDGIKDVPKGKHVAPWKAIVTELRRKWIYKAAENEPEQRERELQRIVADAGKRLQVNGYIDRDNTAGVVWWTGKTDRPLFKPKPVEEPGAGIAPEVKQEFASMDVPF